MSLKDSKLQQPSSRVQNGIQKLESFKQTVEDKIHDIGKKKDETLPVKVTPLHIAFWNNQSRIARLIFEYMTLIKRKND